MAVKTKQFFLELFLANLSLQLQFAARKIDEEESDEASNWLIVAITQKLLGRLSRRNFFGLTCVCFSIKFDHCLFITLAIRYFYFCLLFFDRLKFHIALSCFFNLFSSCIDGDALSRQTEFLLQWPLKQSSDIIHRIVILV